MFSLSSFYSYYGHEKSLLMWHFSFLSICFQYMCEEWKYLGKFVLGLGFSSFLQSKKWQKTYFLRLLFHKWSEKSSKTDKEWHIWQFSESEKKNLKLEKLNFEMMIYLVHDTWSIWNIFFYDEVSLVFFLCFHISFIFSIWESR